MRRKITSDGGNLSSWSDRDQHRASIGQSCEEHWSVALGRLLLRSSDKGNMLLWLLLWDLEGLLELLSRCRGRNGCGNRNRDGGWLVQAWNSDRARS